MNNSLDFSQEDFKSLLDKSTALVLKQFDDVLSKDGYHYFEQSEVESWFKEDVPEEGMPIDDLLQLVEEKVINTATGNAGPNMYAYVMAGGNQVGIVADKLAATINQNVAKWHLAPAITEIEKRVIQWAAEMIGYGKNVGGFLGSSGSSANLDGLTVARNIYFEKQDIRKKGLFGMKPFTVYCSDETHNSVDKSIQLLGIGSDQLRHIPSNADFTINLTELEQQIEADIQKGFHPFCIIGNAGTVNTGAIDDLTALSAIAKKYDLWFHVDGAYGGLASALASTRKLYKGIELADSVALDFHKWLYQPFEVGCILVKDWSYLKRTYFKKASYLDNSLEKADGRLEFNEHHFLLSRSAKALKVWMSVKAFGIRRIKAMIQKDIDLATYLSDQVTKANDFRLVADSDLAISCFQYTKGLTDPEQIIRLNQSLIPALEKDGRVFITGTKLKGEFVLRACLINHRKTKETTDYLLDVIRDVGRDM
ncbi:MAG: aminotransferase class I/II-fold pyridoxal phosphate-dependent enzyme [Chitinophagales bacterium]|nr:aminotransferase class I/II-fold pyridoxal phosphate-dependent enzyme [Chitinophagales bacterium]